MAREITVPEAKPAFEWILGRAVQKVSPQRRIDAYDESGTIAFTGNDRFSRPALSGLSFTLDELFAVLTRPR